MVGLDEFIAEAMSEIVRGIQIAQEGDVGDHIAPLIQGEKRNDFGNFHLKNDPSNQATIVQFDVQVTTELDSEGTGSGKGKFKLFVVDVEVGVGGKVASKSSNVHRLQFAVPVKIPVRDRLRGHASAS